MATSPQAPELGLEMTRKLVLEYLEAHPSFLAENPQLFETLTLPGEKAEGKVVDFQAHALSHLRSASRRLKERFNSLLVSARDNMSVQHQVHHAALAIVKTRTLQ